MRKRSTEKDLYIIYAQECFVETIIDFDDFLSTIASNIRNWLIINKGKGDKETCFISRVWKLYFYK